MLLIGNGRVITRDADTPFIENGAIACNGKLITDVGNYSALRAKYPDAEFIDAKGGLIMPGLINAHNHIYSAMSRGISINGYAPKGFLDILDGMWWTLDRHLDLEATHYSAAATYIDCIKNGCTTVFDHHASFGEIPGSLFAIAEESVRYGIRSCLCYETSDRDGAEKCGQAIRENVEFIKYCRNLRNEADSINIQSGDTDSSGPDGIRTTTESCSTSVSDADLLAGTFGMHAQFTLSDKTLEKCINEAPSDCGFHIHVAEGIEDLHNSLKNHHKRIVDRLHDFGILGSHTILGHCIYINEHEMDLIRDTDTMVVHNPESNMGNAVGCPPTIRIMSKGILTGLGTDGYTNDMFESMKVANVLHKHNLCDPTVAWSEVPQMLFENNALMGARFFSTPIGKLKAGYSADVITLDYDPLTPMNGSNCNGHILFGISGRYVTSTICAGRVLMKDREIIGLDEEEFYARCREVSKKVWNSINS
ncbi:MAG: putative aminohydrolase SsnA [Lachnospiraceae bacterium]|nr:putative aminohydrolase SsnA [Lachnospiraceae bacterium]